MRNTNWLLTVATAGDYWASQAEPTYSIDENCVSTKSAVLVIYKTIKCTYTLKKYSACECELIPIWETDVMVWRYKN